MGSPVLHFVRDVVTCIEESWCEYTISVDQQDNVLAMLTLLHMHIRCIIVEPMVETKTMWRRSKVLYKHVRCWLLVTLNTNIVEFSL